MTRILVLAILIVAANLSWGQTPEDLVRDLRENTASTTRLMNTLQKHAQQLDSAHNGWYNSAALLGHTLYKKDYRYNSSVIAVHAVYRGEQLGYVLVSTYGGDTLFRYVNHDYTAQVLKDYNAANNTDFTWRNLYEDDLMYFEGLPGLYETRRVATPEEAEKGIIWEWPSKITDEYEPLLVKRDHATIIKHCKSFNPARKAYGAYCLYILKNEGVLLSREENELFEKISHSNETTGLLGGCLAYDNIRLSSFLCREYLDPTCEELQTPADLVSALQSKLGSTTAFLKELKTRTAEKNSNGFRGSFDESAGLMGHTRILQRLLYSRRDWARDSIIYTEVFVKAVYKGEKLGYVQMVEHYNIDNTGLFETRELMKYVDSAYANRLLQPYNKKHEMNLDWKDLYEDELDSFETSMAVYTIRRPASGMCLPKRNCNACILPCIGPGSNLPVKIQIAQW
ncbi:hypothetical protein [Niastella sp. OAS944]|uniref:hypothetical protein n=1 Tax=Niastella sp. OAS944 TaxID=2664089 RepID=UPI0034827B30|nr:hypothetical protein [Chitinophagaceae bacterium OAS944]